MEQLSGLQALENTVRTVNSCHLILMTLMMERRRSEKSDSAILCGGSHDHTMFALFVRCIIELYRAQPSSNRERKMNWTGGQLHRSARQGTPSKTQKQNFAKSRQLAIESTSRHPSPFRPFSNLDKRRHTTSRDDQIEPGIGAEGQTESVVKRLPLQSYALALQQCRNTFLY